MEKTKEKSAKMRFGYGKMKRKNYALSLSWSITTRILLPIFLVCGIALGFAINDLFDKVYFTVLASLGFVAGFYLLGFISLFVTGIFLYKRQGFRQDENYMYQGKRKLKKDNIKRVDFGKIGRIFSVTVVPIKDGLFKSVRLLYYFTDYDDAVYFIAKNHLSGYLKEEVRNLIEEIHVMKGVKEEGGRISLTRFVCPCCGYYTYTEEPGTTKRFICPVCYWEDDPNSLKDENYVGKENGVSLAKARENYAKFYACREEHIPFVRVPKEDEYCAYIAECAAENDDNADKKEE